MPAAPKRGAPPADDIAMALSPPRSPERARLAIAIEAYSAARHQLDRVRQALERESDRRWSELEPAVAKAKKALSEARATNPRELVDRILGGDELPDDGAEVELRLEAAQREYDDAERKLTASSEVRKLLADEEVRARAAVSIAEPRLNEAVRDVIRAESAGLIPHFVECRRKFAEAAAALLSLPETLVPPNVSGWQTVGDVNIRVTGNGADPAIAAWLADLREDADAPLPGSPATEPPEPQKAA